MTWPKTKKNPRLRRCQINVSPECQGIFQTMFKKSGWRVACPTCKAFLKKIGTNVERYHKMQEPKEEFKWVDRDNASYKKDQTIEIVDEETGNVIGTKEEKYRQTTTFKEIKEGIENIEKDTEKDKKQLIKLTNQLDSIGKIPEKTRELFKLEKNIRNLTLIESAIKIKGEIGPLMDKIEASNKVIEKRKEVLRDRPK